MGGTASGSRAGSRVGRYHLNRLLGRGTTGEVYEAVDTYKDRPAALKLLTPALGHNPAFREWLQREALTVGRIDEPHIVPVRDYGELDGEAFIDMPLVDGVDLSALLKRNGVLPPSRAVNMLWQAASALDAAHNVGIIHRGIKPRNILLTADDFVYLVDFGLAGAPGMESTDTDNAGGRWKYCAPELFAGGRFGPAVDVYSLTCVLYQSLTGSPPYRADSMKMLANAHLTKPIPRPSHAGSAIPSTFDAVVAKGMAKNPDERYGSTAELATAAYQALSAPDQHRVVHIYEASQQATPPLIKPSLKPPFEPQVSTGQLPPAPVAAAPAMAEPEPVQSPASPITPAAGAATGRFPAEDAWLRPPAGRSALHNPAKRTQLLRVGAALAVLLAAIAWLVNRPHSDESGAEGTETSASSLPAGSAEAQDRLLTLLPAGYPKGVCTTTTPSAGALAEVSCGRNTHTDGPSAATYTLFPDIGTLRTSFDSTVKSTNVTNCPGRIQSPGAWHRSSAPEKVSGTLLCGTRQNTPTLAWTNDTELLIGVLRSERSGPTLEQLYTWWSSHS